VGEEGKLQEAYAVKARWTWCGCTEKARWLVSQLRKLSVPSEYTVFPPFGRLLFFEAPLHNPYTG
jgi:hypothetical protein